MKALEIYFRLCLIFLHKGVESLKAAILWGSLSGISKERQDFPKNPKTTGCKALTTGFDACN